MRKISIISDMQHTVTISQATLDDVARIMEIIALCTEDLNQRELETWSESYPTEQMIRSDVESRSAYVARLDQSDLVVGTIAVTHDIDIESLPHIRWRYEGENYIGLARLGVDPAYHGLGIGRKLFDYADRLAERLGYESVRLDVLSKSTQLTSMYRRRGFEKLGEVTYQDRIFDVMERLVPQVTILQSARREDNRILITECQKIRRVVFIEGQNVPEEIDLDGHDDEFSHLLLKRGDIPAATMRINTSTAHTYKLERLAVLPEFRNLGYGKKLIQAAIEQARRERIQRVHMHAQYYLKDYYQALGFSILGQPFFEASIKHIEMVRDLT
jgi:predicted GNAT family N-acyltransferase